MTQASCPPLTRRANQSARGRCTHAKRADAATAPTPTENSRDTADLRSLSEFQFLLRVPNLENLIRI